VTNFTKQSLLKTKKEILNQVEQGKLSVKTAAHLLGITRQGLWKLRKRYQQYGYLALAGRKRGPRPGIRPHNRTPAWVEEKVEQIYLKYGVGLDTLLWIIDDYSCWKQSYFYQSNNSFNAMICFQHFLNSAPFPVERVRTDNGAEFKKHFTQFCQQKQIKIIRNPVHTPEHNGKVERLHRTVDEECLWRIPQEERTNSETVNYHLAQHSQWYNSKRKHLGYRMNKLTPLQKIEQWILNNKTNQLYQGEVNETLIRYISCLT